MSRSLFDKNDHNIPSAILSDKEILDLIQEGYLIEKETFSQSSVEASSYDLRAGKRGIIGGGGQEVDLEKQHLEISPGGYAGIVSLEKMKLPKQVAARLGAKRALSYDGIILLTGSIVDPGYEGHLLFGLYNASQKKVLIRHGKKICNIVFEKLHVEPSKEVEPDFNLLKGEFPDKFIEGMYNMEVLPWMQISERVKQIESITSEIIDLKKRYEDVMKPIAELTINVNDLTKNIDSVNKRTELLVDDIRNVNTAITENARQITSLTSVVEDQKKGLTAVEISFKSNNLWNKIIWSIIIAAVSILIGYLIRSGR
jgi:dCTP deaminase